MKKKRPLNIIYIILLVVAVIAVLYSGISLVTGGSPMLKSFREHLKSANTLHVDSLYDKAIEPYQRALDMEPMSGIANYNSATNLLLKNYKDIKDNIADPEVVANVYRAANDRFLVAANDDNDKENMAAVYHNSALVYHLTDSLEMAAEAYKESLRNNPKDDETRYNLAVVLYLLSQKQQNQDQNQQEEQQEEQEEQEEQQQNQNQQPNQDNKQQNNKNQEQKDQEQQQQQQQQAAEQQDMTKENAERLLEAAMQDEKGVLERVKQDANRSKKRKLEKDW